jgi:DNA modification methylase
MRKEVIGNATLYLGDCLTILPELRADAVITDPPYGMAYNTNSTRFSGTRGGNKANWGGIAGDDKPFDPSPWLAFERVVLWGANHYASRLPVGTSLVWIKRYAEAFGSFLSDAELAWMKGGHGVYCKQGPFPQSIASDREHPSQKPVELMLWCIEKAKVPDGATVLDPYMGSGTTGLACLQRALPFVGIEMDANYFAVACERIRNAQRQERLFA